MSLDYAPGYCGECQNTGMVECYCGGDLCVCGEEEVYCPVCGGESGEFSCEEIGCTTLDPMENA